MKRSRHPTGKADTEPSPQPEQAPTATSSSLQHDLFPDLPSYDPEPADGVRVGESPVPGLTLRRILRGHEGPIKRIAWSPDGRLLASPSYDGTIRIWDVARGECTAVLESHRDRFNSVAWSPDGRRLAAASLRTIWVWNAATLEPLILEERDIGSNLWSVVWSPDGQKLASGSSDGVVRVWDTALESQSPLTFQPLANEVGTVKWFSDEEGLVATAGDGSIYVLNPKTGIVDMTLQGHQDAATDVEWMPSRQLLISSSFDRTIRLWDGRSGKLIQVIEGAAYAIQTIACSADRTLLASKSAAQVHLWNTADWETVAVLEERGHKDFPSSLAFHPYLPRLATLGSGDTVIRIWDIDVNALLGETVTDSVRYTTAKLVLVGDSGVGKTGLGWRLAHGVFREHSSTHGQQFWVIDELGTTLEDGTQCEAVLWDLAGQHIYRPIHSIFLDNVDASLVLFDPSNRREPLKGAEFWLEQLKGKEQLPPSVLVGARVDRGAPVLSQDELAQFCKRHGISGGYVSTSAKTGEGLEGLIERLKDQIPWDAMTTTVTTFTFKRIKGYVLSLKEQLALEDKTDRQNVLVSSDELREQLASTDPDWQFTDAEMMTAVGHLETHGYVTILRSSSGDEYILLTPDLLVNLASSIVLLADKHPRELGAVSETDLLQGRYAFDELAGLDEAERQMLLDTAVLRFLEHNVCFRETFGLGAERPDTLLIFPGLIKQKRPLVDDFPATDDVSYVVRGRVENLYAMLVVLLGYTPTFVRINHWQNQAQYVVDKEEICGFRMIADREGEIELVLYYSERTPQSGRGQFQELFERFLYQRDVEVTRFPPVLCPAGHRLERATVVGRIRDGKTFAFCAECGNRVDLPDLERPGIGTGASVWLEREEAAARLRSTYEQCLARVKSYRRGWATPRCYLSHVPGQEDCAADLIHDLQDAGVHIILDAEQVELDDYVVVLDTLVFQDAWRDPAPAFERDVNLVRARLRGDKRRLVSIKLEGKPTSAPSHGIDDCTPGDFCDPTHYPVSLFNLVLNLYAIPLNHAAFAPLRETLHKQWERIPRETLIEDDDEVLMKQERKTDDEEEGDVPVSEQYVDFDLHVGPDGHTVASSSEGQAMARVPLDLPNTIELALSLIEARQTNSKLLKQVGQALYDWLLPGPIHTHFHQTEAVARQDDTKMRLRLRIDPEEIASLPLEFLYRKVGGYYVAINPDTVLSRYLHLPMPPGYVRSREGPLHMLAIIADPSDQVRLPPDEWEGILEEALAKPLENGQMTLRTVRHAARKEIRNALLQQKPDMIQFVGHGIYQDGKGYLALVNEKTGRTWLVDDERFANLFLGYDDHLGLVSLATCESAKSDDPQGFLGIAPKLVQRGVPAVVAMKYQVYIKTAKVFLEEFYTAVAARKPIDWATQIARNAISLEYGLDNREFVTPVLYMRARHGEIF